uniref:Uncharacterized protein n=1 Tax=Acanthochromis polyacanthus TaxID=80966 RepID=A0A3Q1G7M4_9TELE
MLEPLSVTMIMLCDFMTVYLGNLPQELRKSDQYLLSILLAAPHVYRPVFSSVFFSVTRSETHIQVVKAALKLRVTLNSQMKPSAAASAPNCVSVRRLRT